MKNFIENFRFKENAYFVIPVIFLLAISYFIYIDYIYTPLTKQVLRNAYDRYSYYKENYVNVENYINNFEINNYRVYSVRGFASFYLEKDKSDIIKSSLRSGSRWEAYLANEMSKYVKKGSNVIDVGAHIGTHTVALSKILEGTGTVWAFEPQKKLFIELNSNLLLNDAKNVKTLRYAAGEIASQIEMNPPLSTNEGGTSIGRGGDKADMISIDSLNIKNVSFIKIDAEGYEDHVLNGARHTISTYKPVMVVEIQGGQDRNEKIIREKIRHTLTILKKFGYQTRQISAHDYLALPFRAGK